METIIDTLGKLILKDEIYYSYQWTPVFSILLEILRFFKEVATFPYS